MACWSSANAPCLLAAALLVSACGPGVELPSYGVVDDFQLTAESSQPFDSKSLAGKVWIADFIFTNCSGPCPRMSSGMHKVQTALDGVSDVRLISFTVDPDRDTPEVLAAYAKRFKAEPGRWSFLTGPKPVLHRLTRDVFKLGEVDGSLEHSIRFTLVDKQGRIRGFYVSTDPEQLSRLIAHAKALAKS